MTKCVITCDRDGDICRAAVWQGKMLCDLYVDSLSAPDFSGATACGKIVRLLTGQKAGWVECGLGEKVYIESSVPLKTGTFVTVRVLSMDGHGKAWRGALVKEDGNFVRQDLAHDCSKSGLKSSPLEGEDLGEGEETGERGSVLHSPSPVPSLEGRGTLLQMRSRNQSFKCDSYIQANGVLGLITPPLTPWQRALGGLKAGDKALLRFAVRDDFEAFQETNTDGRFVAEFVAKEPVHDGLDEIIDGLLNPVVPLSGGGALVIEPTEALVAIDVNGGEATNLTALNLVAVREAARQVRLRNLSGILVIDCLKMKERADASKVINAFARVAEGDPARVQFIGMSKLGLLECTRGRKGPALGKIIKEEVVCARP